MDSYREQKQLNNCFLLELCLVRTFEMTAGDTGGSNGEHLNTMSSPSCCPYAVVSYFQFVYLDICVCVREHGYVYLLELFRRDTLL